MVYYTADRITANVPFPPDATDIVFDRHRPYLGCIAPAALDATLDFFRKEMAAIGWKPLSAADAAARWPNARLDETIANGVRAYYTHDDGNGFYRQQPIMLTLQRRDDGRTDVEIRVAPFALPADARGRFRYGRPAEAELASRPRGAPAVAIRPAARWRPPSIAEIPAVLAFYRRELAARGWTGGGQWRRRHAGRSRAQFLLRRADRHAASSAANTI